MSALDTFAACRVEGPRIMAALVDSHTGLSRFHSLQALDQALRTLGFSVAENQVYGPPGGRQIFYKNGRMFVRVKTRGDGAGFRANQPHMSAAITDGEVSFRDGRIGRSAGAEARDWFNDSAKLNAHGRLEAKAYTTAELFKPTDFQNNPQRLVMIRGGKDTGPGPDAWANRTHFPFPPGFLATGADALR